MIMFMHLLLLLIMMSAQNTQGLICSDMALRGPGEQYGTKMTELNPSCTIAQLVSSGLLTSKQTQTPSNRSSGGNSSSPVAALFRLLGLEPSQIRAVTLNSLLFIAQLKYVSSIKDQSLAHHIVDAVNGHISLYTNMTCPQLLICRLMPFIHGMQRSVIPLLSDAGYYSTTGIDIFFSSLPDERDMEDAADRCALQYSECVY